MGVTTVGIVNSEVTEHKVLESVRVYFDPGARMEEILKGKLYNIRFRDGKHDRELAVHLKNSDLQSIPEYREFLSPMIKEVTLISIGFWGRSTAIIKTIVGEFGGHMTNNDHEEEWLTVEANEKQYEESIHQYVWKEETMEQIRKDAWSAFKRKMPKGWFCIDIGFSKKNNLIAVSYGHEHYKLYGFQLFVLPTYKGNAIITDDIVKNWSMNDPEYSTKEGLDAYKDLQKEMVKEGYFFVKADPSEPIYPYTAIK
jgi:hypothetical protein